MVRYQQLIGILHCVVELGSIDIQIEVALVSQCQASPRVGHLWVLYLIFHYFSKKPRKQLVMDPHQPYIDEGDSNIIAEWDPKHASTFG